MPPRGALAQRDAEAFRGAVGEEVAARPAWAVVDLPSLQRAVDECVLCAAS